MTKDSRLPWTESPERNWLYKVCGGLYQDRLLELSYAVLVARNSPRGFPIVPSVTQTAVPSVGAGGTLGYDLVWCDLGFNIVALHEWNKLRENAPTKKKRLGGTVIVGSLSGYPAAALSVWHKAFNIELDGKPEAEPIAEGLRRQLRGRPAKLRRPTQQIQHEWQDSQITSMYSSAGIAEFFIFLGRNHRSRIATFLIILGYFFLPPSLHGLLYLLVPFILL